MGIVRIHGMSFFGYHGVYPAEKELANNFVVDAEFVWDTAKAASNDNLNDALNYVELYSIVESIVTKLRFHLVETLAETIADNLFNRYQLSALLIRVRKRNPPIAGHLEYVEVETQRGHF